MANRRKNKNSTGITIIFDRGSAAGNVFNRNCNFYFSSFIWLFQKIRKEVQEYKNWYRAWGVSWKPRWWSFYFGCLKYYLICLVVEAFVARYSKSHPIQPDVLVWLKLILYAVMVACLLGVYGVLSSYFLVLYRHTRFYRKELDLLICLKRSLCKS